jgi:hypothetical protein
MKNVPFGKVVSGFFVKCIEILATVETTMDEKAY